MIYLSNFWLRVTTFSFVSWPWSNASWTIWLRRFSIFCIRNSSIDESPFLWCKFGGRRQKTLYNSKLTIVVIICRNICEESVSFWLFLFLFGEEYISLIKWIPFDLPLGSCIWLVVIENNKCRSKWKQINDINFIKRDIRTILNNTSEKLVISNFTIACNRSNIHFIANLIIVFNSYRWVSIMENGGTNRGVRPQYWGESRSSARHLVGRLSPSESDS